MQTVYKALIRSTNGRLTTTPRRGKIIVTAESISNEWETVALSAITDIKLEKLFGLPFCITIRYGHGEEKVFSFSCYGHTKELYEHILSVVKPHP